MARFLRLAASAAALQLTVCSAAMLRATPASKNATQFATTTPTSARTDTANRTSGSVAGPVATAKNSSLLEPFQLKNITSLAATALAAPHGVNTSVTPAGSAPTMAEVSRYRETLEIMASSLESSLANGKLANSKVASEMQAFVNTLRTTLKETVGMKNTTLAMLKLENAKAGIASLAGELCHEEEALMKSDEAQKTSLLLGVLMVRKRESMQMQLSILASVDFRDLEVSKALLAQHDPKTPLYLQAAAYVDKHPATAPHGQMASQQEDAQAKLQMMAANIEKKVHSLQADQAEGQRQHALKLQKLDAALAKVPKSAAQSTRTLKTKLARDYQRWSEMRSGEIASLQSAAVAIRAGDLQALEQAQAALTKAMKAVQAQTGGFLHFLQLGHQLTNTDCPYCAAQCLEKCHNLGKAYVTCLGDCADAAKGK